MSSSLMGAIEEALLQQEKKIFDAGFQKGVERGRFEQTSADRPKFDRLKKLEELVQRSWRFVVEQERLNHAASCPGRRGHSSLCECGGGARMGDFFEIMGDLCVAVEEGPTGEAKRQEQRENCRCGSIQCSYCMSR